MNESVTLPAGSTLGKSFELGIDINLGTYGQPDWRPVRRPSAIAPTFPAVTSDVGTYDDRGAPNEDVDSRGFAATFTVQGNRSLATGLLLPELEAIIAASRSTRDGAVLDIRFYHKPDVGTPNPNDAGRVLVRVDANRQNTGNTGAEVYAVTFTGKGAFTPIPNPFQGWGASAPRVSSVTPEGANDGDLVTINGEGLLTATSVSIGGKPAPEIAVVDAGTIIAVMPTGDAGAVPVVATTAGGNSAAYTFNRGA